MIRPLVPALALAMAICSFVPALADDAREKTVATTTDPAVQPKIRVILPASWEPATPQTPSPQRSAAR